MTLLNRLPPAIQQSALYALALAGAKGVSLLMVPVFTHYLSPADYGKLDVLQTLADILSIVIGMGLADTLFRFCNDRDMDRAKTVAARLYGVSWLIALLALIITQTAAPLLAKLLPGDVTLTQTRLILTSLSLSGTILVPLAWLRFRTRANIYMAGTLGRTLFQAALGATLLFQGFGVTGFIAAGFVACVTLSLGLAFYQLRDTGIQFGLGAFKQFAPYGGPLIFAGFAGFILGSFDRLILAETIGTAEMAQYALAAKFGLITAVLIQPFDMWWHAKRFSTLKQENGKQACARFGLIATFIVCFAMMGVNTLSPSLIEWMTPVSYHQSIQYVPYLVIFAGIHNLTQTLGFGIYTQKTTKLPALIDGISAGVALVLYFTLIPRFGINGTLIATFSALIFRFTTTYFYAQKTCVFPYRSGVMITIFSFASVCSLLITSFTASASQILFGMSATLMLLGAAYVILTKDNFTGNSYGTVETL